MSQRLPSPRALSRAALLCASLAVVCLSDERPADAAPKASELSMMRAKGHEAERLSRERVEVLFSRLCPGRCELLEVKAIVSEPKPVGQVMPGFDAPSASEVKVNSIEAKIMIDSSLPRSFRSNLPKMVQHRLSDLSARVVVTPIQLQFPKPQLPPSPPMLPEAKPPQPAPLPPPPEPEPKSEPEPEEPAPLTPEPVEEPWSPVELIPYAFALLLLTLIWGLWRQLGALRSELKESRERAPLDVTEPRLAGRSEELLPDLDQLHARLSASRVVSNEALRVWLKEDIVEVATLARLLGPGILSDLKLDPELQDEIARVSEQVRRQRAPLSPESAWRAAHALEARLTAAELVAQERALKSSWDFLQSVTPEALYVLYRGLGYAEQSHLLSQLPYHLRGRFLARLSAEERKALVLYGSAERPLTREASLELSYQLKRLLQERAGAEADGGAQLELILEMLGGMDFNQQVSTLVTLDEQRPELAEAVLSSVCLEGALPLLPAEVLTEALILSPFEDVLTVLRCAEPSVQSHLISALPAQRSPLYLDELSVSREADLERLPSVRASFLQKVMVSAQRGGHKISDVNRAAMRALYS